MTCLPVGSFEPVIVEDECPISQWALTALVTAFEDTAFEDTAFDDTAAAAADDDGATSESLTSLSDLQAL